MHCVRLRRELPCRSRALPDVQWLRLGIRKLAALLRPVRRDRFERRHAKRVRVLNKEAGGGVSALQPSPRSHRPPAFVCLRVQAEKRIPRNSWLALLDSAALRIVCVTFVSRACAYRARTALSRVEWSGSDGTRTRDLRRGRPRQRSRRGVRKLDPPANPGRSTRGPSLGTHGSRAPLRAPATAAAGAADFE
jgi:hypothetical protein